MTWFPILHVVVTGYEQVDVPVSVEIAGVTKAFGVLATLAGVVAAVRFRFTLNQPSDAMYIFVAIGLGLGAGIGALGIAAVISFTYSMATLVIWKLEYGKTLAGPFLTMLTRRDAGEDQY